MTYKGPLITIGVTAFNEGKLLRDAWNSVLNQSSENWEAVMVLDGGGNQKTRMYFDSIQHSRMKKFSYNFNQGTYRCRSKAIELAETEWYFQLDADDLLPSNAIELVVDIIHNDPKAEFVAGACEYFSLGSNQIRHPQTNPEMLALSPLFVAAAPIRKKLYKKIGGYYIPNHFLHSDWDFWLSVFEKNINGHVTNDIIYKRRRRNNSVSLQNLSDLDKGLELIISRHPVFFNSEDRKCNARYNLYEKIARNYRAIGNRRNAAKYAREALKYGDSIPAFETIFQEEKMSTLRYVLRRLGRFV